MVSRREGGPIHSILISAVVSPAKDRQGDCLNRHFSRGKSSLLSMVRPARPLIWMPMKPVEVILPSVLLGKKVARVSL